MDTNTILEAYGLNDAQKAAARERARDVVVTAGAGSGKTRTLVARYLTLLLEGHQPTEIIAITFTEKAALEMRERIRKELRKLILTTTNPLEQEAWSAIEAGLNAARIGTIHSLCSEIIRSHPAEAGIDPQFNVITEGETAILREEAIQTSLTWAVQQPELRALFATYSVTMLTKLLQRMLDKRLEVDEWIAKGKSDPGEAIRAAIRSFLTDSEIAGAMNDLRCWHNNNELISLGGDKLALKVKEVLPLWETLISQIETADPYQLALDLFQFRRAFPNGRLGSKGDVKETCKLIREGYDNQVHPWLGGKSGSDTPPSPEAEHAYQASLPLLVTVYQKTLNAYQQSLEALDGLDFDSLEAGALRVLGMKSPRQHWQAETAFVLVDEFQDTNQRQRELIDHLCADRQGKLFVVGDARQSIYRFRGADVTVFKNVKDEIQTKEGLATELALTYRTHPALLDGFESLLAPIMGTVEDPKQPYHVPFTPMKPGRETPAEGMVDPFVELHVGIGENATAGREAAAQLLAKRLIDMKDSGEIANWGEVALLFRATSGFGVYETAFEAAGIPYVSIAGSGFYDKPEIRDLLNMLTALANPWDDLAQVGFLRSPAIGLSDAALFTLRQNGSGERQPFYLAIQDPHPELNAQDQEKVRFAAQLQAELGTKINRQPVGVVLKELIDHTHYPAVMAAVSNRAARNIDKLLQETLSSGYIKVQDYLIYLNLIKDTGVREGEAPTEANQSVQLMSIHKSKGLEFKVVVLADASHRSGGFASDLYLLKEMGLCPNADKAERKPLAYQLSRRVDQKYAEAESNRILYVALTRAQEKLIISGHASQGSHHLRSDGWIKDMLNILMISLEEYQDEPLSEIRKLGENQALRLEMAPFDPEWTPAVQPATPEVALSTAPSDLCEPLEIKESEAASDEISANKFIWRATGTAVRPPAWVIGKMVHEALQHWYFPGEPFLEELLTKTALRHELVNPTQQAAAVDHCKQLLNRFKTHPIWQEIDQAQERYHELPYVHPGDDGIIDLLYRSNGGWHILDFKSDHLNGELSLQAAVREYTPQLRRYRGAVQRLLKVDAESIICFLDYQDGVHIEAVEGE
jgi:ATP-dependent exoDNAse (exonuclease V) beta subunit